MRFHSAITDLPSTRDAAATLIADARQALGNKVDAVFLFLSPHHIEESEEVVEKIWLELDPQALIGCSAESVIGGDRELERRPGMSILAATLPDVRLHPFHIADWDEVMSDSEALSHRMGLGPLTRAIIGFGDPFSTPVNKLLPMLDEHASHAPLIGGMSSGGRSHGENRLFHNDCSHSEGFVGLSIAGSVEVSTLVSQGCRPIGKPVVITRAHDNIIEQLGGRPALEVLRDLVTQLPEVDRELLAHGLFIGQAITEYRERFDRGDFLVRNVIGIDDSAKTIAVAEYVRPGRTAQFHVRDADTASEDLALLLESHRARGTSPAGTLLFNCNGRGTRLFSDEGHDIRATQLAFPETRVAGFFAAGEFGPVGGRNFLHGHTASFAMFRPSVVTQEAQHEYRSSSRK